MSASDAVSSTRVSEVSDRSIFIGTYLMCLDSLARLGTTWIRMMCTPWISAPAQVGVIIRLQWWDLNKVSPAGCVSVSPALSVLDLTSSGEV